MRFLVDECTGPAVAAWLQEQNHEVFSVFEQSRGMNDEDIIHKAYSENWILITNDKDFGCIRAPAGSPYKPIFSVFLKALFQPQKHRFRAKKRSSF